jgi:hypothetical protein
MRYRENRGKPDERDISDDDAAEYENTRRYDRKRQRFQLVVSVPTDYPKDDISRAQRTVHRKIDGEGVIEPKVKIDVRDIEYHKDKATVSAYMFRDDNCFVVVSAAAVVLVFDGVYDIRYRYDRHYDKPVIIKQIYKAVSLYLCRKNIRSSRNIPFRRAR